MQGIHIREQYSTLNDGHTFREYMCIYNESPNFLPQAIRVISKMTFILELDFPRLEGYIPQFRRIRRSTLPLDRRPSGGKLTIGLSGIEPVV